MDRSAGLPDRKAALLPPTQGDFSPTGPWIMTASGRAYPFLSPAPDRIFLSDIAAALAKICRFNGHTRTYYSVAQHSVLVADLLPATPDGRLQLYGLLHDAHEAYLGDVTTPLKWARRHLSYTGGVGDDADAIMARTSQRAIHAALGLDEPTAEQRRLIREADLLALAIERRDIMPAPAPGEPDWDIPLPSTDGQRRIEPLDWSRAESLFLQRFRTLRSRS